MIEGLAYPFPLTPDFLCSITLPRRGLKACELERLTQFLGALVTEDRPTVSAGASEPFMAKERVDALYEPLTDDEKRALLSAVRAYPLGDVPFPELSAAANKLEAQLHLSNTGHRIYEGPPS